MKFSKSSTKKLEDGTLISPPLEDMAPFMSRRELKDNMIILRNIILSLNEISYITEILQHQVLVMKKEDDYYWNTSINNSSILKV